MQVIPHGSSVFSYHMQYAFPNCPMAEVQPACHPLMLSSCFAIASDAIVAPPAASTWC